MLGIIVLLAGIACFFKKQINVNKNKMVEGTSIKVLGAVLIISSVGISFLDKTGIKAYQTKLYILYTLIALPLITLIFIMVKCSKDIETESEDE